MKSAGFIVTSGLGGAPMLLLQRSTECWENVPRAGILLLEDRHVTVFRTRPAARAAIKRTADYFEKENRPSPFDDLTVVRLVRS